MSETSRVQISTGSSDGAPSGTRTPEYYPKPLSFMILMVWYNLIKTKERTIVLCFIVWTNNNKVDQLRIYSESKANCFLALKSSRIQD